MLVNAAFHSSPHRSGHTNSALKIDVNAASADELTLLPGVGPVLAERIVQNRNTNGPFQSIEDLSRVHGIGDKTVSAIRNIGEVRHNH